MHRFIYIDGRGGSHGPTKRLRVKSYTSALLITKGSTHDIILEQIKDTPMAFFLCHPDPTIDTLSVFSLAFIDKYRLKTIDETNCSFDMVAIPHESNIDSFVILSKHYVTLVLKYESLIAVDKILI
ncbi:hypothetical protein CEXT_193251 [Caerostris extrusa]|uniref:Uncharacterized protein n=1 Tax=Caerostris extrusa TaxID=172846 RepID=A0AAV4Q0D5_CAEEX|nr:hypothetical protein CEXT_193251 [Caerostris extrusa]